MWSRNTEGGHDTKPDIRLVDKQVLLLLGFNLTHTHTGTNKHAHTCTHTPQTASQ